MPPPTPVARRCELLLVVSFCVGQDCGTGLGVRDADTDCCGRGSAKPGSHSDGNGLILRVLLTGGKRWVWRGTVQGRRRDFGLGSYPTVSLKEARTKALEYLRIGRTGGDSSDARSQVPPFEQAAEKVIQLHRPKWKPGGRSEEQWRASLANYVSHESATNQSTRSLPMTSWSAWLLSGIPDQQRLGGPASGSPPLCVGASLTVIERTTRVTTESQPPWGRTPNAPSTSRSYTTVEWLEPLPRFENLRPFRQCALQSNSPS